MNRKMFFIATAMAIVLFVLVGSFALVGTAKAQGPEEFYVNVPLPKGTSWVYPMLSNENLCVKPSGADVVLTLTSARPFNVYDAKGAAPVVTINEKGVDSFASALSFADKAETCYTLGAGAEGLIFDIKALFEAPKATADMTFDLTIGFNKPKAVPTPAPTVAPVVAKLNWVARTVTVTKEESKIADLKSGGKAYLDYTVDITVTAKIVSKGPFVANGTLNNKPDAKGVYSSTVTYTKAAHPQIAIDLAKEPVELYATLNTGEKAEVKLVTSVDDGKLPSGQNIVLDQQPASGKKADPGTTPSGLSPTGGADPSSNFLLDLWNAFLSFIGLRPALVPSF